MVTETKRSLYTIRLEANFSKQEILEGYLNTIYYGHGAYGIEAASQYYFNKSAKNLTLNEAAMLVGIPKGPSYYSPFHSYERAKARQELILKEMAKQNRISEQAAILAAKEPIQFVSPTEKKHEQIAPYFQDIVRAQLEDIGLDERTIHLGGLRVQTTLDPKLQKIAEKQVEKTIPENSLLQTALVAMDPNTGDVKALIGGRNYEESSFNRAIQAKRQPASTIKPILYYAAIARGFTPVSTFRSEPTTFTFDNGREEYTPKNFNHKYADDEITLMQALALSDNIYAVKTHLYLGMETLADMAKQFGIQSKVDVIPSAALGTTNVRVLEMTNAYSHFANGGKHVEPVFIKKVTNANGDVLYEHTFQPKQILDPDSVFVVTHMMTGIFDKTLNGYANVTGSNILSKLTRPYAGKSGTSNTDSWMIGFTPDLVTAVWTGYDKGKTMNRTDEKQYAKHIWADFMETALADEPIKPFSPTDGVIGVGIDPETGLLATKACEKSATRILLMELNQRNTAMPMKLKKKIKSPKHQKTKCHGINGFLIGFREFLEERVSKLVAPPLFCV